MKTKTGIALIFMYIFSFNCAVSFAQETNQFQFTETEQKEYLALKERIEEYEKQILKLKIEAINTQIENKELTADEAQELKMEASEQAVQNIQDLNEIVDAYISYTKRNLDNMELDFTEFDFSELNLDFPLDKMQNLADILQDLNSFFQAVKYETSPDYSDLKQKRSEVRQKREELLRAREELKALRQEQFDEKKFEIMSPPTPLTPPTPPSPEDPNLPPMPENPDQQEVTKIKGSRSDDALVIAIAFNNALPDGGSLDDTGIRFGGSRTFEIGYARDTRFFQHTNWLRIKYGVSLQFNGLKPEGNRVFAVNGDQTNIEEFDFNLRKNKFRMDNLIFPLHLQMGTNGVRTNKKGDKWFTDHNFKVGLGGFVGLNLLNTNKLKYTNAEGQRIKERIRDDFNTNNFLYGLSAYVGWDDVSLFVQYNLNPIFNNNPVDAHNVQFGVRFDFN